ncbi:uncharacterized protein LOC131689118 [Topomyia yanbarensis]|uniref:uncharacterized protein LOC131689118 n=1 Tax=Topomyia yanbarensis TaxID=2498891 RepID=UPI00273C3E48|nr:uncharacterized protein LOC131689118 [Topomyia yanbarensis]XP_058829944.1 uncharacterized protein LOC131689118 [Topomyia yanbarensis]XP_058829945.1 uncharacterized protein LOC131689118 [Topomyia yanbarensis]XP_058829947.1 uncharacterized protein LOC131689118 [Topomyia yanbarensis]
MLAIMESDVICLDSDEEGENEPVDRKKGEMEINTRAIIDEVLLRPLQALSLKLYFESDCIGAPSLLAGDGHNGLLSYDRLAIDENRCTAIVRRVAELVQRFGRQRFPSGSGDLALQREAWRQVLKFLFLLRAIGPGSMIYDGAGNSVASGHPRELPSGTRRYRLTVMDVLVDYIRHKCSVLAGERNPAVLLTESNQIVSNLYIIFDGDSEFVTLTLLKTDLLAGSSAVALMYPVFEQILTSQARRTAHPLSLMDFVRLLLCYKKWKAMVPARRDKDSIGALATKILPTRCPEAKAKQDLPFVRMLPRVSATAKGQDNETRFLLSKDLMDIEQLCTIYFREYEKRFFQRYERKLSALEVKSNHINIDALAEFIQRKCNLLRGIHRQVESTTTKSINSSSTHQQQQQQQRKQQLQHESNAIISSLRLIFRRDEYFITLTLLRVETGPAWQCILGPVYERFLAQLDPATVTTNSVESYGRLLLCYVKWKLLYGDPDKSGPAGVHWERIDTIALATLPYDFPRAVKRKELALKDLFPKVATAVGRRRGKSAKVTVTRALLNSKHIQDNIQEMCLKFLAICRDGRTNRADISTTIGTQLTSDDDEVEIIKSESNSVIVLDSDDEFEPDNCTDTDTMCSKTTECVDFIGRGQHLETERYCANGKMFETDQSLMETVFNTPPATPKADDALQDCQSARSVSTAVCKARKQKRLLPPGVNFKISKNIRLHSCRKKRDFLTAFRKLASKKCFHVRLSSDLVDYCLLKKMCDATVFVEVISFEDTHPTVAIPLKISGNDLLFANRSFSSPASIILEEPILQNIDAKSLVDKEHTEDDQLMTLIAGIDDIPSLPSSSVDFAIFAEEPERFSIEALTNDQAPPSSVMDECFMWPDDAYSIFSNLDFNLWLEPEFSSFAPQPPKTASLV